MPELEINYLLFTVYCLSLDAPKSICETEKNPKNPPVWAKNPKKPNKPKKPKKKPKKPKKTQKNPLGWVFLKKPGFFSTLVRCVDTIIKT